LLFVALAFVAVLWGGVQLSNIKGVLEAKKGSNHQTSKGGIQPLERKKTLQMLGGKAMSYQELKLHFQ